MSDSPPIRIRRQGFRKWFPVSRDELKRACAFAEVTARSVTWETPEGLCRFLTWSIGEQLGRQLEALIEGRHDNDQPVISIHLGDMMPFIAVRGVPIEEQPVVELRTKVASFFDPKQEPTAEMRAAVAKMAQQVGVESAVASASKVPGTGKPAKK